jgi:hypothetical protein
MTLPGAVPEPPTKKRAAWSFRTLVEEVSGRPLSDFQEPGVGPAPKASRSGALAVPAPHGVRAVHEPSARSEVLAPGAPGIAVPAGTDVATELGPEVVPIPASATEVAPDDGPDPVTRVYPPLSGTTARELHGVEAEHHRAILRSVVGPSEAPQPGDRPHPPGPSRRPERIYLHYLLLHLDRLQDVPLRYLKHAVDEELATREGAGTPP